jgi:hypothetical protein
LTTFFDFLTVACFVSIAIAFFQFTGREISTLLRLLLSGLAFAVANQIGNAGWTLAAIALVAAGAVYAAMVIRRANGQTS